MDSARYDLEFREGQPLLSGLTPTFSPHAEITTQRFRGHVWFVAQDPVSLQYFRFGPTEHKVVKLLDGEHTLRMIHQELARELRAEAPPFQDIVAFVQMLRSANLLDTPETEQLDALYKRVDKKRSQRTKQVFSNLLFIQVPLYDPDKFLNRTIAAVRWLFSRWFLVLWSLVVLTGFALFFWNIGDLAAGRKEVLAPENMMFLWISFVGLKLIHEFSHAYLAKHFGCEVHKMGIMFLIFTPCAFVDTTGLWAVESKHKRALVACEGMMIEVFIATFALIVWLMVEQGPVRSVAYNVIFIASVSSVLFNGNPLLRFDAYYILSDWAELPNLWTNSRKQIYHVLKRFLLGVEEPPVTEDARERFWLFTYGVTSMIYRVFVVTGILLVVSNMFFGLGVALGAMALVSWVIIPTGKMFHYLLFAKATRRKRFRCIAVATLIATAIFLPLASLRLPQHIYAPCALMEQERTAVRARWGGFVESIHVKDGQRVREGDLIVVCLNREVEYDVVRAETGIRTSRVRLARFEKENHEAGAQAERARIEALTQTLATLRQRVASLRVTAPCDGLLIAPGIENVPGRFLKPGDPIAVVAQEPFSKIVVVMDQSGIADVQALEGKKGYVRFSHDGATEYACQIAKVFPQATYDIPSPGLTNLGGGPVILDPSAPDKDRTLLPWFRVELALPDDAPRVPLGATGSVQFTIATRPLFEQWSYKIRRLLQTRFSIF
ncbi:hypothetical protein HQ560_12590 [bacterium]|nr:hypothetical protein [bacterium]